MLPCHRWQRQLRPCRPPLALLVNDHRVTTTAKALGRPGAGRGSRRSLAIGVFHVHVRRAALACRGLLERPARRRPAAGPQQGLQGHPGACASKSPACRRRRVSARGARKAFEGAVQRWLEQWPPALEPDAVAWIDGSIVPLGATAAGAHRGLSVGAIATESAQHELRAPRRPAAFFRSGRSAKRRRRDAYQLVGSRPGATRRMVFASGKAEANGCHRER